MALVATIPHPQRLYAAAEDPAPIPHPEQLVGVGAAHAGTELTFREILSAPEVVDVREKTTTLEGVVAWDLGRRVLAGGKAPERLFTAFWWGDPLATLGVAPLYGRSFTVEETLRGDKVAILSHRVWQRLFEADPLSIGKGVTVEGEPYLLIGVLPPDVAIDDTELWLTMWSPPELLPRERRQFQILARVREGHDLDSVNTELRALARQTETEHGALISGYAGWRLEARRWDEVARERSRGR
jgi:hypothetical protein